MLEAGPGGKPGRQLDLAPVDEDGVAGPPQRHLIAGAIKTRALDVGLIDGRASTVLDQPTEAVALRDEGQVEGSADGGAPAHSIVGMAALGRARLNPGASTAIVADGDAMHHPGHGKLSPWPTDTELGIEVRP